MVQMATLLVNGGGLTIKDGANEATKLTKDDLQINDGGNKAGYYR